LATPPAPAFTERLIHFLITLSSAIERVLVQPLADLTAYPENYEAIPNRLRVALAACRLQSSLR